MDKSLYLVAYDVVVVEGTQLAADVQLGPALDESSVVVAQSGLETTNNNVTRSSKLALLPSTMVNSSLTCRMASFLQETFSTLLCNTCVQ